MAHQNDYLVCSDSLIHNGTTYNQGATVTLTCTEKKSYAENGAILELVVPTNPVPSILFDSNGDPIF